MNDRVYDRLVIGVAMAFVVICLLIILAAAIRILI